MTVPANPNFHNHPPSPGSKPASGTGPSHTSGAVNASASPATAGPPLRALVIDDEIQLRRLLKLALQSRGYQVFEAASGSLGLSEAAFRKPDVILLDLGLPDMDGLDVLQRLREWTDTPVLVLSVRDQENIKVAALENGADDYVTKPFSTAELVARLQAIQRRRKAPDEAALTLGALTFDFAARSVLLAGEPLKLTATEYSLLKLLARHAGRILTGNRILTTVWGPNAGEHAQYLRVYVGHLRKKITGSGVEIKNDPGIGYRLVVMGADEKSGAD